MLDDTIHEVDFHLGHVKNHRVAAPGAAKLALDTDLIHWPRLWLAKCVQRTWEFDRLASDILRR